MAQTEEGEKWSKIDRFPLDAAWLEKFNFKLWGLPRVVSDHCPILLMEDSRDWGPRPFRFLNASALHPNFLQTVEKVWKETMVERWVGYKLFI